MFGIQQIAVVSRNACDASPSTIISMGTSSAPPPALRTCKIVHGQPVCWKNVTVQLIACRYTLDCRSSRNQEGRAPKHAAQCCDVCSCTSRHMTAGAPTNATASCHQQGQRRQDQADAISGAEGPQVLVGDEPLACKPISHQDAQEYCRPRSSGEPSAAGWCTAHAQLCSSDFVSTTRIGQATRNGAWRGAPAACRQHV